MTDFAAIYKSTADLIAQFRAQKKDADDNADLDRNSAVIIQRVYRGTLSRNRIRIKGLAALEIQRVFRGHVGRKSFRRASADLYQHKQHARIRFFVIYIQRCFRGFYSRRYKQNFASRKKYVEFIVGSAADVREKIARYAEEQAATMQAEAEQHANDEFRTLAQDLHHLVGTKAIRGIYNPNPHLMHEPTAQAVPIEEHLRGVVRDLLRTTGRTSHRGGLVKDINGTNKIPYKGPLNRLSLQASSPYDAVKEEERKAKVLHKVLTVDRNNEFIPCRKPQKSTYIPTSADDPFLDRWANPFFTRGVPQNEAQLKQSVAVRKPLFALPTDPEHNWYLSTGGNKSATLPNNVFDVIHEAGITGGTAKRHLGKSSRLGVPPSADNRGFQGSTLPAPPLKDTKVLYGESAVHSRSTLFTGGHSTTLNEPRGAGKLDAAPASASVDFSATASSGSMGSKQPDGARGSTESHGVQQQRQYAQTQVPQQQPGANPLRAKTLNGPRGLKLKTQNSSSSMIVKVKGLLPMSPMAAGGGRMSPGGTMADGSTASASVPPAVDPYESSDDEN